MANNRQPRPLNSLNGPVVDSEGKPTPYFLRLLRDLATRADKTTTDLGQIHAEVPVVGRTDGIGTTVQNLNQQGQLVSTDNIAADGAGSPLTGGKRAAQALDSNNQLASSFNNNPSNVTNLPTSSTSLSNDGISHVIVIATETRQFGSGPKTYQGGTVDPGIFGTFFIYADDPKFLGGIVSYHFTTDPTVLTAADGRLRFGKITTLGGSANTGGGNTGGTTPGGQGGTGIILS